MHWGKLQVSSKFNGAVHRIDEECNEGFGLTGDRGWNGWRTDDSTHLRVTGNRDIHMEMREETDIGLVTYCNPGGQPGGVAVEALEEVAGLEVHCMGLTMSSLEMMGSGSSLISSGVWS